MKVVKKHTIVIGTSKDFVVCDVMYTVSLVPQKLLGVSQAEIKQKCQDRVKELDELKTAVDSLKVRSQLIIIN